jgi:hypothetical protein
MDRQEAMSAHRRNPQSDSREDVMRLRAVRSLLVTGASALTLAACGGGGGMSFIPAPPVTPTPAPSPTPTPTPPPVTSQADATIFAHPTPGDYATVGVTSQTAPLDTIAAFGPLSTAQSEQVHIRYTSGGFYEVQLPGRDWDRLVTDKGTSASNPADLNILQPSLAPQNLELIIIGQARKQGYQYSEIASWFDRVAIKSGQFAFGVATPLGAVPITGNAAYHGIASGTTDIVGSDGWGGYNVGLKGTVDLNFDFAAGSLAGAMTLALDDYSGGNPVGTFSFKDTVFSAGSPTYSGKFDTPVAGDNFFLGQFTGPHAEETIGAWALPFVYSNGTTSAPADNKVHQAIGAWIAKP